MGNIALSRRKKFKGQGYNVVKNENTPKIQQMFDLPSLDLMVYYTLTSNSNIKRASYVNMRNMFEMLDMDMYEHDPEKMKRINFIVKALKARLEENMTNYKAIIKYVNDGFLDETQLDISDQDLVLSTKELEWIDGTISQTLKFAFIENEVDRLLDLLTKFKSCNYLSKASIVEQVEDAAKALMTKFRQVSSMRVQDTMFSLKEGVFENVIADTHDKLTSPHNRILCGMRGLNELTYGGFEATRCYIFYGVPGVGKSTLAVNLALQIKEANKFYICKDQTKRPAVLLITMENNIYETVERIFDIVVSSNDELQNYSKQDLVDILREEGELFVSSDSPIDILIKYVPNGSVDTSYLYNITEELEDEGVEVIALILDYLNCMHSAYKCTDMRIELGNVVAECKTFAVIKDIPIITFSQLNREAAKMIDAAKLNNQADVTRVLGRSQIAESIIMLYYMDWGSIINVDYDSKGNKYMVFNRFKIRGKCTPRYYICQPFRDPNGISLLTDINKPVPIFKETLKDDVSSIGMKSSRLMSRGIEENNNTQPEMTAEQKQHLELFNRMDRLNNGDNIFTMSKLRSTPVNSLAYSPTLDKEAEEESQIQPFTKLIMPVIFDNAH